MNKPQTALECAREIDEIACDIERGDFHKDKAAAIIEAYAQQRCAALVAALEFIMQGGGMLNQPAAMNGPDDAWLRRRISHYESIAYTALAQFKGEKVDA